MALRYLSQSPPQEVMLARLIAKQEATAYTPKPSSSQEMDALQGLIVNEELVWQDNLIQAQTRY